MSENVNGTTEAIETVAANSIDKTAVIAAGVSGVAITAMCFMFVAYTNKKRAEHEEKLRKEQEEKDRLAREEARKKELEDREWNLERDRERWERQVSENAKIRAFEIQMPEAYWEYRKIEAEEKTKLGIAKEFADSEVQVAREEAEANKYTADRMASIEDSKYTNRMKERAAKYSAVAKSVGQVMSGINISADFLNRPAEVTREEDKDDGESTD